MKPYLFSILFLAYLINPLPAHAGNSLNPSVGTDVFLYYPEPITDPGQTPPPSALEPVYPSPAPTTQPPFIMRTDDIPNSPDSTNLPSPAPANKHIYPKPHQPLLSSPTPQPTPTSQPHNLQAPTITPKPTQDENPTPKPDQEITTNNPDQSNPSSPSHPSPSPAPIDQIIDQNPQPTPIHATNEYTNPPRRTLIHQIKSKIQAFVSMVFNHH